MGEVVSAADVAEMLGRPRRYSKNVLRAMDRREADFEAATGKSIVRQIGRNRTWQIDADGARAFVEWYRPILDSSDEGKISEEWRVLVEQGFAVFRLEMEGLGLGDALVLCGIDGPWFERREPDEWSTHGNR